MGDWHIRIDPHGPEIYEGETWVADTCREYAQEIIDDHNAAAKLRAANDRIAALEAALAPMLDEFGARLSDGKPLGYTAGSMNRALKMIRDASEALAGDSSQARAALAAETEE
jgi:hypothetical protein